MKKVVGKNPSNQSLGTLINDGETPLTSYEPNKDLMNIQGNQGMQGA